MFAPLARTRLTLLAGLALFALASILPGTAPPCAAASTDWRVLQVDQTAVRYRQTGETLRLPRATLEAWIRRSVQEIGTYYGGFPVRAFDLELRGGYGRRMGLGMTYGGQRIALSVGRDITRARLDGDWVFTHEMLHLTFPRLHRRHRWMREGLATYVEPVVRARAGRISSADVWERFTDRMHHGLPRAGDRGLDRTPTWGRTYWGGTLYWFVADVRIRRATRGRRSIEHALRAIARAGGTGTVRWDVERTLQIGDRATGTTVLMDLYRQMARQPGQVDLPGLFRELGVSPEGTRFDPNAPLAWVRQGITAPHGS